MSQAIRQPLLMTHVISCSFAIALLSIFQPIPSASAQQLTRPISQEISRISTQRKSLEKKDTQTPTRKPHRLIRKPQNAPIVTVEPSPSGSSPVSSMPRLPSSLHHRDNTISQSKEPPSLSRSAGAAVPLATMNIAPSSATATGPAAASTVPNKTIPLAAASTGNSSTSGSGDAGGRTMRRLAAEMPGLAQLISPPSAPVVSVNPAIGTSPPSLSFTAQQGGGNPAAQTLSISNTGGGTLSWSASDSATWLTLSPASGTGNGAVTLGAATGTLTAGSYSGTVTLSATGATAVTVPVTFTVTAAAAMTVSPVSLSFTATQGVANPASQSMTVSSNGTWTVNKSATWLTLSPISGSSNGTITASVNTATATLGANNDTITVTGGGVTRTVPVALILNASATSSRTLTWNSNTEPDVASYRIYRSTTPGVYGAALATVQKPATTYVATGLAVGTTYYFTMTAVDSSGNESPHSNEVSASIF